MWSKIKFGLLIRDFLPKAIYKPLNVSFFKSCVSPIESLHYKWSVMRAENIYKLEHSGQVCYLRKALNDKFDPEQRRIYIGDANRFERFYIYTRAENKPKYLGKVFLHQRSDYADTGVDFIVYVPEEIINAIPFQLKSTIEFYKIGGKRYKIERI